MKDYEIFIIWDSARKYEKEIIGLIEDNFKIIKTITVCWSKDRFTENLTTFYETDLRLSIDQIETRGNGEFIVLFVEDSKPNFCIKNLKGDICDVNENVFFLKNSIRRSITGKANVHASLNCSECNNNLVKLFGLTIEEMLALEVDELNYHSEDCLGVGGWKSLKDVFKVLNNCSEYVVLRGGDNLIDDYSFEKDGDIDILVRDLPKLSMILQPSIDRKNNYCFVNKLEINEKKIFIHAKYVGDNYYDEKWQKRILETRQWNGKIYVPSDVMLYWTLLYHGLFHKNNYLKYEKVISSISSKYGLVFCRDSNVMVEYLANWMRANGYKCSLHLDGPAAQLNYDNIPADLLVENRRFYFYNICLDEKPVKSIIICDELIRKNPVLFTEVLRDFDLLYDIEKHVIPSNSSLYFELNKKAEKGELIWQYTIRNSGISVLVFYYTNSGKSFFDKCYVSLPYDESRCDVNFVPGNQIEYYKGRTVDYYIKYHFITSTEGELYKEIREYIKAVFDMFSEDGENLKPLAWDMLSHNCIKEGSNYLFFDLEAKSKSFVKKSIFVAYEVKHLKDIGVCTANSKELYEQLCNDFNLIVEDYDYLVTQRRNQEYHITKYGLNVNNSLYSRYIDVQINQTCDVTKGSLEKKFLSAKVNDSWKKYFTNKCIRQVVVYGVGKYGKILLSQLESEPVEVVACCDLNVHMYKKYTVVNDILDIPLNDLVIVAILNGESIKNELIKHNWANVITIEELLNAIEE